VLIDAGGGLAWFVHGATIRDAAPACDRRRPGTGTNCAPRRVARSAPAR
jgi:hypothetical protein